MNEAIFFFCNVLNGEKYNFLGGIYTHPIGFLRTEKGIVLEGLNMFIVQVTETIDNSFQSDKNMVHV